MLSLALPLVALLQAAVVPEKPAKGLSELAEFYLIMRECVKVQGWLEPGSGRITTETRVGRQWELRSVLDRGIRR
jgi:hypothetical protein